MTVVQANFLVQEAAQASCLHETERVFGLQWGAPFPLGGLGDFHLLSQGAVCCSLGCKKPNLGIENAC
jgi:hypothetical protein